MKKISNVFWISVVIVVIAVAYGALAPVSFEQVTSNMKDFITSSFGWYYLLFVTGIVLILPVFHRQSDGANYARQARRRT